jgi:hypothetical protein
LSENAIDLREKEFTRENGFYSNSNYARCLGAKPVRAASRRDFSRLEAALTGIAVSK